MQDFGRAQRFADKYFEDYRPIHVYGQKWDEEQFMHNAPRMPHSALHKEMVRMRGFEDDLEKLKAVHTHGVLSVEARRLKSLLVPVAESALSTMKKVLLQMARDKVSVKLMFPFKLTSPTPVLFDPRAAASIKNQRHPSIVHQNGK